jgi:hypothetical protein
VKVYPITISTARPFIEQWHYSGRCPTGKNLFFGMYVTGLSGTQANLFGETLYAVTDYGIGVNPYQAQSLSKIANRTIDTEHLLELKRLCRIEPRLEQYPLTQFLARCHKMLKPLGYTDIVSFSDPTFGHSGGIYKAANFQYLGKTNAENHAEDSEGVSRHRRLYFRFARRNGISNEEARKRLGLRLVKTQPKDRWLLQLQRSRT